MPTQDDIAQQQQLLATYRRNLAHELSRAAQYGGEPRAPLEVANGIAQARAEIARIKAVLRGWGGVVEDLPDDEELRTQAVGEPAQPPARDQPMKPAGIAADPCGTDHQHLPPPTAVPDRPRLPHWWKLPTTARQWCVIGQWTIGTALGWTILVVGVTGGFLLGLQIWLVIVLSGFLGGLGLGFVQWWCLRRFGQHGWRWVVASAVGMSVGVSVGASGGLIVTGVVGGAVLGFTQWWCLRWVPVARAWIAMSWILANSLGAGVGLAVARIVGLGQAGLVRSLLGAVVGGGLCGLITGAALVGLNRLSNEPNSQEC